MKHKKPRYSLYEIARGKGRFYSGLAHFVLLIMALIGMPDFLMPEKPLEPVAITVELLPISEISNVKPQQKQPKPEEKKEEAKPKEEPKKETPPVKTEEEKKPEPEKEAVPEPKEEKKPEEKKPEPKKEEKKPEPKKEEKKKKEEPKKDLAAILKAVREQAEKKHEDDPKPVKEEQKSLSQAISESYNETMPMSISERDAIMSQIAKCWNVPAGARNAQNLVVVLNVEYAVDGRNLRVEVAPENMGKYQSDSFFRAAADAAVRAVQRCTPLRYLPVQKYDTWHYMVLRFDPKYMLN